MAAIKLHKASSVRLLKGFEPLLDTVNNRYTTAAATRGLCCDSGCSYQAVQGLGMSIGWV